MKKINITLDNEAEKVFNDIMYSLPKNKDGTGLCTQSQAINYALIRLNELEKTEETNLRKNDWFYDLD